MQYSQRKPNEILRRWRRQILARRDRSNVVARQGLVAMSIIDQSKSNSRYVELDGALVVLAYEEPSVRASRRSCLRLAGYRLRRLPHGVEWGGVANTALFKNMNYVPQRGARGERLDLNKCELAALALKLDRRIARAARYPALSCPALKLPPVWAGFHRQRAAALSGAGPEFERMCHQLKKEPAEVFRATTRVYAGLQLFPLEWVDDFLGDATALFVELTPSFWRPVFRVAAMPEGLTGFQGASAFDFYSSRFRRAAATQGRGTSSTGCRTESLAVVSN